MTKDGRIQIPKIYLKEQQQTDPNNCLTEVNLKPVEVNFKKAERIERYILPNRL